MANKATFHATRPPISYGVAFSFEIDASSPVPARLAIDKPALSAARLMIVAIANCERDGLAGACFDFGGGSEDTPAAICRAADDLLVDARRRVVA